MAPPTKPIITSRKPPAHPFRRAVLRGLGVVLPPLLTVVIFVWVYTTVRQYVLMPVESGVRYVVSRSIADVRVFKPQEEAFEQTENGDWIPQPVHKIVKDNAVRVNGARPDSGIEYYEAYVQHRYLQPYVVIPLFLSIFILAMYFLGKFLAAGIGRVVWNLFERGILQLPLVRNVYSSVKQVTDFMFRETEFEYTRVVAVEYPRKGCWSLGFVTSESMLDIRAAANEPVAAVFVPSSPMPVTGWTITFLRSEIVDLNLSIDQAFQFIISCGVVVPASQMQAMFNDAKALPPGDGESTKPPGALPAPATDQGTV